MYLAHSFDIIRDVLKNVIAQHRIECVVFERNAVYVHLYFGQGRFYICRDISISMNSFKTFDEACIGGNMEYLKSGAKERCFFPEI